MPDEISTLHEIEIIPCDNDKVHDAVGILRIIAAREQIARDEILARC
jgi:hypothetical protein